jgi:hypothetical protein
MANVKTRSLKKNLIVGRARAKSSHERVRAESAHAFLDALVGDRLIQEERFAMDGAIKAYYDNLSPAERGEQSDWGRIGESSLARFKD